MLKIKILPEILSNKIAAGEVVERPSSVVKELIENAVDAKSTKIIIEIEKGGRSLIRVSDNGLGMSHDDALLSMERYATSKIYNDNDLFNISTMGFRGEALPSIASVSKFFLSTRAKDAETGCEVIIYGGKIQKVTEVGIPTGTMISVRQLFFNTPARRKFLKSISTEMGHIADTVSCMALAWPEIQFKLIHDGKTVKNWPKAPDHFDRVVDVLGHSLSNELHQVQFKRGPVSVLGWISSPRVSRSNSKKIFLYINGRYIRDRGIQYALFEGYRGRLMKGKFPLAVLYLNIPFDTLDVNVHPTKHEVRFSQPREVYQAVKESIVRLWDKVEQAKWHVSKEYTYEQPDSGIAEEDVRERKEVLKNNFISDPDGVYDTKDRRGKNEAFHFGENISENTIAKAENDEVDALLKTTTESESSDFSKSAPVFNKTQPGLKPGPGIAKDNQDGKQVAFEVGKISAGKAADDREKPQQKTLWEDKDFSDLKIIGQFHNTYILCEAKQELLLIDQHAAHERIFFEMLKKKSVAGGGGAQRLLIPETIDLNYSEAELLEKLIPNLSAYGLEIEPFGGNTFVIKTLPSMIADSEVKPLILEILGKMDDLGFIPDPENSGIEKVMDECLILIACHGAIRAKQRLSEKEMRGLLKQLDWCENPSHCPHGRPTWIKWTVKELEKEFRRVV